MKSVLLLEDGSYFEGTPLSDQDDKFGPVVLYTGVVGYQEVITDPANAGKIVVFTYPLIGNCGAARKFSESKRAWIGGMVIKEKSRISSNWQAEERFDLFLKKEKVSCLTEVDTRTLAIKIRDDGEIWGAISSRPKNRHGLIRKIKEIKSQKISFLKRLSVRKLTHVVPGSSSNSKRLVVIDLGVCNSLLRQLDSLGFAVDLAPYNVKSRDILRLGPDGIILSSGPEDDPLLDVVTKTTKDILGAIPILGISTGHQVIARALGARLCRLKVGHRGLNYPVGEPSSFKGKITVQNHSLIVDEDSLKEIEGVDILERNLNDDSIEKMKSDKLNSISIQYYPASPGLGQPHEIFEEFTRLMDMKEKG